jgi:hypothetical protein
MFVATGRLAQSIAMMVSVVSSSINVTPNIDFRFILNTSFVPVGRAKFGWYWAKRGVREIIF